MPTSIRPSSSARIQASLPSGPTVRSSRTVPHKVMGVLKKLYTLWNKNAKQRFRLQKLNYSSVQLQYWTVKRSHDYSLLPKFEDVQLSSF